MTSTANTAHGNMPAFYSRSMELCQQRSLRACMDAAGQGRALEIGCGTGRWSVELATRGWAVTGIDFSPERLDQARRRADENCVRCNFRLGDMASDALDEKFELILSVTYLQQILDHDRAAATLARLAAALAPGGQLVLCEAAPTHRGNRQDNKHSCARTFDWYRRTLNDAGLNVVNVLGVDPVPLTNWMLPHYRQLPRLLGDLALGALTALSLPLDWLLGPSLPTPSWHKVIVATAP